MDLATIRNYYCNASIVELQKIAEQPTDLSRDVIRLLKEELTKRGDIETANLVDERIRATLMRNKYASASYLTQKDKQEIIEEIKERLAGGEMIESVRIDLLERGIDISELHTEDEVDINLYDVVTHLSDNKATEEEIKDVLINNIGLQEDEATDSIKKVHEQRSKVRQIEIVFFMIGLLLIGSSIWLLSEVNFERQNLYFPVVMLCVGIGLVVNVASRKS